MLVSARSPLRHPSRGAALLARGDRRARLRPVDRGQPCRHVRRGLLVDPGLRLPPHAADPRRGAGGAGGCWGWPGRAPGRRGGAALVLAALPILVPDAPLPPGIVFAEESPYNTVFVEQQGGTRCCASRPEAGLPLRAAGAGDAHRGVLRRPLTGAAPRAGERAGPGHGGGTTVRAYRRFYPGARVTAVEIDPVVVRVAHEYMGSSGGSDLDVHVRGRTAVPEAGDGPFDVIEVDLFAGGPYAPFYCLTREFFEAVRATARPSGLVSMNVTLPAATARSPSRRRDARRGVPDRPIPLAEERVLVRVKEEISVEHVRALLSDPGCPRSSGSRAARRRSRCSRRQPVAGRPDGRPRSRGAADARDDRPQGRIRRRAPGTEEKPPQRRARRAKTSPVHTSRSLRLPATRESRMNHQHMPVASAALQRSLFQSRTGGEGLGDSASLAGFN